MAIRLWILISIFLTSLGTYSVHAADDDAKSKCTNPRIWERIALPSRQSVFGGFSYLTGIIRQKIQVPPKRAESSSSDQTESPAPGLETDIEANHDRFITETHHTDDTFRGD